MDQHLILKKASDFPHVFKVRPIKDGQPEEPGTWGSYPFDDVMLFWVNSSHKEAIDFYKYIIKKEEIYQMTKALTIKEDEQVKSLLANNIKAIKSVLPKHLTPERALRVAYMSLVKTPLLARCTQVSLMNAIIEASTLGLEVGGPLRHAALIPFKNNKINAYEAVLVPEYPGLIMLANNTGNVKSITAQAVFEKDQFKYNYGLNPDLVHIPSEFVDAGKLINAYAIIQYLNGGFDFEVIGEKVAMQAKNKSAAKFKKDSPWNQEDNQPAMWKKTAIRRLMNRVPKSAEIRNQMDTEERQISHINIDLEEMQAVQIPETTTEKEVKKPEKQKKAEPKKEKTQKVEPDDYPKEIKQAISLKKQFAEDYYNACIKLSLHSDPEKVTPEDAVRIIKEVGSMLDTENQ